ncbi:MAG: ribonuclease P [Candidatus Micrarchaeota archaeon]|nr:ribonuclease P [Candidatus Micrarchaeota archaeon]
MNKRELILERIEWLLSLAEKSIKARPDRTKRYVSLARKLSTRYRVAIPKRFKKRICKICNTIWIPGYNVKIRLNKRKKSVEYNCECGSVRRFGYAKKRD